MKFSLALPCDDCLKNELHVVGGVAAAISLFGDAAFKIKFLIDSSNFSKPFLSDDVDEDSFRMDWFVWCVDSRTVESRRISSLLIWLLFGGVIDLIHLLW